MDLVTLLAVGALAKEVGLSLQPRTCPPAGLGAIVLAQARSGTDEIALDAASFDDADRLSAIDQWKPYIAEAARRFGIPEPWIRAVMRAESGGETTLNGRPITSPAGAKGLMQVMPDTYAAVGALEGLGSNPYDPRDNILAGAAYLREMYDRFGYPALFAAYNAGPDRFQAYLRNGAPLPDETWRYLAVISQPVAKAIALEQRPAVSNSFAATIPVQAPSGAGLFFAMSPPVAHVGNADAWRSGNRVPTADSAQAESRRGALFVPFGLLPARPHRPDEGY
jgi:soluble lytic murein transglycosylase-like protein